MVIIALPLHVLVQDIHIDIGCSPEHVVRLVLPAHSVQRASYEVGPLVSLREVLDRAAMSLSSLKRPSARMTMCQKKTGKVKRMNRYTQ